MLEVNKANLARLIGVSRSAISQAVARGDLIQTADGTINIADKRNAYFLGIHLTPALLAKMKEGAK